MFQDFRWSGSLSILSRNFNYIGTSILVFRILRNYCSNLFHQYDSHSNIWYSTLSFVSSPFLLTVLILHLSFFLLQSATESVNMIFSVLQIFFSLLFNWLILPSHWWNIFRFYSLFVIFCFFRVYRIFTAFISSDFVKKCFIWLELWFIYFPDVNWKLLKFCVLKDMFDFWGISRVNFFVCLQWSIPVLEYIFIERCFRTSGVACYSLSCGDVIFLSISEFQSLVWFSLWRFWARFSW